MAGPASPTRLLIAAPLRIEALLVRAGAPRAHVHRTGMGPARARQAGSMLREAPGDALLVLGFCGGLDAQSRPGEVIVADELLDDPRPGAGERGGEGGRPASLNADSLAATLAARGLAPRRGPLVSVARLALGEQRSELHEAGAIAVDMESLWLAAGAGTRPLGVVRVVLDSPSHELLRPGAAVGALRAARALRQVALALGDWWPEDIGPSGSAGKGSAPPGRSANV